MKKKEEKQSTEKTETEIAEATEYRRLLGDDGEKVRQVREFHCILPLAGSGKIP